MTKSYKAVDTLAPPNQNPVYATGSRGSLEKVEGQEQRSERVAMAHAAFCIEVIFIGRVTAMQIFTG